MTGGRTIRGWSRLLAGAALLAAGNWHRGCTAAEATGAAATAEGIAFFEKKIRPVLVEHCHQCHAADAKNVRGGLLVDSHEALRAGGESGRPGVVPGDPNASSIYLAINHADSDERMPPKARLPDHVIADVRTWIEMGAPDPRTAVDGQATGRRAIDVAEGRKHWAFQRPVAPAVPAVRRADWPRSDIDRFLLAGMEAAGVSPVADADRATLIRRLSFDLTGMPPTPEEVRAFVADPSPKAVEAVVDRLLDSPRFGERWARHWLDVARYAESNGKETNFPYPHAWRYRDYVIASFRDDKPFDLFLKEQIAGDLLRAAGPRDQAEKIVATGFLALGAKGLNDQNPRQFHMDLVDEQIDVVSQAMLGLTLACARCHDHKFDPVSQRDYYALAGIFLSSETLYGTYAQQQNLRPSTLVELDAAAGQPASVAALSPADMERLRREYAALDEAATELEREAVAARRSGENNANVVNFVRVRAARDRAAGARSDLDLFHSDGSPRTLAMGVLDRPQQRNAQLLVRGDVDQTADTVPRGLVEVLCSADEPRKIAAGSGRLDLAYWIASPDNPLTARVMANRVWLKLMGQGIVTTPDNFGVMGMKPTHPELLDHLASAFVADGWSVKRLVRGIVTSRAYQLASTHDGRNHAVDPDNRLRWRMDQRRLDAEAIRDAMLAVSGTLDERPPVGSPVARVREDRQGVIQLLTEMRTRRSPHRSIYLPIVRDQVPDFLNIFDFPDASLVSGQRDATNVPSQGLFLLNNPEAMELAAAFARRLGDLPGTIPEKLARGHEMAVGRPPNPGEREAIERFWKEFPSRVDTGLATDTPEHRQQTQRMAGVAYCQALFGSAEFRYLH